MSDPIAFAKQGITINGVDLFRSAALGEADAGSSPAATQGASQGLPSRQILVMLAGFAALIWWASR